MTASRAMGSVPRGFFIHPNVTEIRVARTSYFLSPIRTARWGKESRRSPLPICWGEGHVKSPYLPSRAPALFCHEKLHSCTDALSRQTERWEMHFEAIHQFENPIAVEVWARPRVESNAHEWE
jgi:hypothetical protein